nr:integrase core domain-containing protein [Hydrogenophilus thermoluteolus]
MYWTYPKSPCMNAHCERFNRTVQEQFVDWHEDLLFTDLTRFNQKLGQWLIDYNTVLPHHSLDLKASVQWLMENHKVPKVLDEYTCLTNRRNRLY